MTEQHQNLSYSILSMMIDEYFQTLTTFPPRNFQREAIAKLLNHQDILQSIYLLPKNTEIMLIHLFY